jgi:hypothetical protein
MKLLNPLPVNNNVTTHTAETAYTRVLDHAGASFKRDAADNRVINNVRNGNYTAAGSAGSTNGIIDSQADVGGWPVLNASSPLLDTDGDGMPDDWEKANQLDHSKANANGRNLSTAYDNIEVYINSLVKSITEAQSK